MNNKHRIKARELFRRSLPRAALGAMGTFAIVAGGPAFAGEVDDLKAQLEALTKKIETIEQRQTEAEKKAETAPAGGSLDNVVTGGDFPGSFKLPGTDTSVALGGYVKADFIYDLKAPPLAGGGDFAVIASAPLEGTAAHDKQGESRFHAKETRINIRTSTPTEYGPLKTFIEGDFFDENNDQIGTEAIGNKTSFGIRHAFGEFGPLLAGQTWTNFMDITAFAEKVDFTGPAGRTFLRQGQIRYTHKTEGGDAIAVAIENPNGDFNGRSDSNIDDTLPDLTGSWRINGPDWHVKLNGLVRQIAIDEGIGGGDNDETIGWAVGLTGAAIVPGTKKDRVSWYTVYGDGVGRYLEGGNGLGASLSADGALSTQVGYGGFASYRHWWTDELRTNVVAGASFFDNDENQTATANAEIYSGYINLIWSPVPKADIGVEYIYGIREVEDGRQGEVSRFQVGTKYRF